MTRANPYEGFVSPLDAGEFRSLSSAVSERECRERYGFGTFAEAAAIYRPNPPCPRCGLPDPGRDGFTDSGLQRFECRSCGCRFNSLTGTVLEHSKKDMPTWVGFVNVMRFNVPLDAAAELCGITHQTAFEWRHRIFATVDGYQDKIVLRDTFWLDETYVNDTDLSHGYGEARKRGLSKQKVCIAVAIDVHKNPVAVVIGHGKPSSRRMEEGMLPRYRAGVPHGPRPGEVARRPHPEGGADRRGAQGRRARPGVPRGHADGEQPLLVDQALPVALHRHEHGQPAVLSELVRLPVQGEAGEREVARNGKGGPPSADDGRALPQLNVSQEAPVF